MFTLEVHYNGRFQKNPWLTYVGGSVKKLDDIDPDFIPGLDVNELLRHMHLPINMPICYMDPSGKFIKLDSGEGILEMFGIFRDEPYIGLYVGQPPTLRPQLQSLELEIPAAEPETNLPDVTQTTEVEKSNLEEEKQVNNSSGTESDGSYIPEDVESTDNGSDFNFFLDGDTLSDGCDQIAECDMTTGFVDNTDLGEYQAYAELISDEFREFMEAKKHGYIVENENVSDHEMLEAAIDSSDEESREHFPEFNEERDMVNPQIEVSLIFPTVQVYRKALRMYSILKGFELQFLKNDSDKVTAICRKKCGWKIYASNYRRTKAFQIKSIKGSPHRCPWAFKNRSANARWLASIFSRELCDDPKWSLKGFKETVRRKFRLHSSKYQIYRAKNHALEMIQGKHKEQYYRLRDYCATVMLKNPGSVAYVVSEVVSLNQNPIFKRMFVMYNAQKDGFIQGCRPVIGLDACHLRGKFGGHLMHAVGRDGNNQMYPLAMAWVESECKESWTWFLATLTGQIGSPVDMHWVFISDRQKGLVETFTELFPGVEHRFCVRHMYANFKLRFKDKTLRNIMWAAARAYLQEHWSRKMIELQAADVDAYNWLSAIPPHLWARCMFNPRSKCDLLSNNISESFNQYISAARDEPILSMFESIRRLIMCRYQEKREWIAKIKCSICPRIHDKLEANRARSIDYEAIPAGLGIWEVTELGQNYVVNLGGRTCTCREWDMTGIPCVHGCAAIINSDIEATDYVHPYYSMDYYKRAYKHIIMPIPCKEQWVQTGEAPTEPPELRKRPGRPRKARRKGPDEQRDATVVTRKGLAMHCRNCGQAGHNIKTCKAPRRSSTFEQGETQTVETQDVETVMESQVTLVSTSSISRGIRSKGGRPRSEQASSSTSMANSRRTSSLRGKSTNSIRATSRVSATVNNSTGAVITATNRATTTPNTERGRRARKQGSRGRGIWARGSRGRGSVNPGPYSGIGNWNGIGMSNGSYFMHADQLAGMVMQHTNDSSEVHTVQMWSNSSQTGSHTIHPNVAPTHSRPNFQVQREETQFGEVLFYSQPGSNGMHVQPE